MQSLAVAPRSTLRWWGLQSVPAFDHVSSFLTSCDFLGPITWRDGASVSFSKTLCATIRVTVSLSTFTSDKGYAAFDCTSVFHSKSIHDHLAEGGLEGNAGSRPLFPGFKPCLAVSLAHMKWCQRETEVNPSWAMTLGHDASRPNAFNFEEDFNSLMTPLIASVQGDVELRALLRASLGRSKPSWVKSDAPWFVRLPELLDALDSALSHRGSV